MYNRGLEARLVRRRAIRESWGVNFKISVIQSDQPCEQQSERAAWRTIGAKSQLGLRHEVGLAIYWIIIAMTEKDLSK